MSNQTNAVWRTGDIVLAPFPFANHSISKLRPAILVSSLPHDRWLVIYITSADTVETLYDALLEPDNHNNLKKSSIARVNRMTVISTEMIQRHFGSLNKADKAQVQNKLQAISTDF